MKVPEKFEVRKGKLVFNEYAKYPSRQDEVVNLIQNVYGLVDTGCT